MSDGACRLVLLDDDGMVRGDTVAGFEVLEGQPARVWPG